MQIGGLFLENIKVMYKTIEYCIMVYGGFTDPIESLLGLKQGSMVSPVLFNLFIDDIKQYLMNHVTLFKFILTKSIICHMWMT